MRTGADPGGLPDSDRQPMSSGGTMRKQLNALGSLATILGATTMQLGGCGPADIFRAFANTNPCGSLLFCDPQVYSFIQADIDEPGVIPEKDPFCTFAPYCSVDQDPLYGGLVGAGP
jgi:hypothetical protein